MLLFSVQYRRDVSLRVLVVGETLGSFRGVLIVRQSMRCSSSGSGLDWVPRVGSRTPSLLNPLGYRLPTSRLD